MHEVYENRPGSPRDVIAGVRVPATKTVTGEIDVTPDALDIGSEEETDELMAAVENCELPPDLAAVVRDEGVLGDRDLFTWQWIYHIFGDMLTLPCVPDEYAETAQETKFLLGTYITLMDDLAEKHGDAETFWELAKVAVPEASPDWDRPGIRTDYAVGTRAVWEALEERLARAPRHDEFRETLLFDLRTAIHGMDFARLSSAHPRHANRVETWRHETDAIGMAATVGSDLLFSPGVGEDDCRRLRESLQELERLWRLGNWIITWKREAREGDFSAGIYLEAVQQGIVSRDDLDAVQAGDRPAADVVRPIEESGIAGRFAYDWTRRRDELRDRELGIEAFDADELVDAMEQLMCSHLATEGHR